MSYRNPLCLDDKFIVKRYTGAWVCVSAHSRERERERARMRMLTVESFRRDAFMCVTCPEPYFMCRHQFVCFEEEKPLDSFLKPDSIFSWFVRNCFVVVFFFDEVRQETIQDSIFLGDSLSQNSCKCSWFLSSESHRDAAIVTSFEDFAGQYDWLGGKSSFKFRIEPIFSDFCCDPNFRNRFYGVSDGCRSN